MNGATLSFQDIVRSRRSVRHFRSDPVPRAIIDEVLHDAQHSPSNCNTQPWSVHIVSGSARDALSEALHKARDANNLSPDFSWDETAYYGRYGERRREHGHIYYENLGVARTDMEARREAHKANYSFFNAPHVALLFVPVIGDNVRVAGDLGMYGQTFLLSLAARGLGGVPQTVIGFYADTVRSTLGIGEEFRLLFGISFGYPDEGAIANTHRIGRDPVPGCVTFHT